MRRFALVLAGLATFLVVAAAPAAAKEGVKATLLTKIALHATPGTPLKVSWRLAYPQNGRQQPFGANGVFIRLASGTGEHAETAFAPTAAHTDGEYTATVTVPEGGIADVSIGLQGWSSVGGEADMLFPITNDPLPGAAAPIRSSAASADPGFPWLIILVLASLFTLTVAVILMRRKAGPRPLERLS